MSKEKIIEKSNYEKELQLNNCTLSIKKRGDYENLYITTPNGVKTQIKLAFYNRKLDYLLKCEIKGVTK